MSLKKFTKFVLEKQTDKDLKDRLEKELANEAGDCPRCGKAFEQCICPEVDYYSTMNIYRTPKGEEKK